VKLQQVRDEAYFASLRRKRYALRNGGMNGRQIRRALTPIICAIAVLLTACTGADSNLPEALATTSAWFERGDLPTPGSNNRSPQILAMHHLGLSEIDVLRLTPEQARAWAVPVDVAGVAVKVPMPAGFRDRCNNDAAHLEQLRKSNVRVTTLACYVPRGDAVGGTQVSAVLTALAGPRHVPETEFDQYKALLLDQVTLVRAQFEGYNASQLRAQAAPLAGGAKVLDQLRASRSYVVHAAVRPSAEQATPMMMTTVLVRGRLLYLTISISGYSGAIPWESLARISEDWASELLTQTLWSR